MRWADYSGSGTIWAYKGGLEADIADMFRLRGTYSRDVRAANLSERFDKTGGAATVTDPRNLLDNNPANDNQIYNVTIFSGGNPNVKPEKADTWTAGVVFNPSFLPGLSVSVDWYRHQDQRRDRTGRHAIGRQSLPRIGAGAGILQPYHAQQRQPRRRARR